MLVPAICVPMPSLPARGPVTQVFYIYRFFSYSHTSNKAAARTDRVVYQTAPVPGLIHRASSVFFLSVASGRTSFARPPPTLVQKVVSIVAILQLHSLSDLRKPKSQGCFGGDVELGWRQPWLLHCCLDSRWLLRIAIGRSRTTSRRNGLMLNSLLLLLLCRQLSTCTPRSPNRDTIRLLRNMFLPRIRPLLPQRGLKLVMLLCLQSLSRRLL